MSVEILAPLPGKVLKIMVKAGDQVAEDDEIMVLEAMKMANPVYSTVTGSILEIRIKEGDEVEVDQVLVVVKLP
jgi:acetyl-CoA carboxylase biotin carboxyl carrier protein